MIDYVVGNPDLATIYAIRDVRLFSTDPGTRFDAPAPRTAGEHLWAANGHFATGKSKEALAAYANALEVAGPLDHAVAVQARFFRAMLLFRAGNRTEAQKDLRAAFDLDPDALRRVIQFSWPGLSTDERALFRNE